MDQVTIARLLAPYAVLPEKIFTNISTYIDLLVKWNTKVNLTAIRTPEEMVTRHFGESFFAATRLITPDWQGAILDFGSGAGFPGMPLAMYAPAATVSLLESQGKKAAFLNEVIFTLKLGNATVFNGRAERYGGTADLVTMRAVERFERSLPAAASLVCPGGRLALFIGISQVKAAEDTTSEFSWDAPIKMPGSEGKVLLVGTKIVKVE